MIPYQLGDKVIYKNANDYATSHGFIVGQSYEVIDSEGFLAAYNPTTDVAMILWRVADSSDAANTFVKV